MGAFLILWPANPNLRGIMGWAGELVVSIKERWPGDMSLLPQHPYLTSKEKQCMWHGSFIWVRSLVDVNYLLSWNPLHTRCVTNKQHYVALSRICNRVTGKQIHEKIWRRHSKEGNKWTHLRVKKNLSLPCFLRERRRGLGIAKRQWECHLLVEELTLCHGRFQTYFRMLAGQCENWILFSSCLSNNARFWRTSSMGFVNHCCHCVRDRCDVHSAQLLWLVGTFVHSLKGQKNQPWSEEKKKGSLFPGMTIAFCAKILTQSENHFFPHELFAGKKRIQLFMVFIPCLLRNFLKEYCT